MTVWLCEEIARLEQYLEAHEGEKTDWRRCAAFVKSRNARQCYDYFQLQMDSNAGMQQRHVWTADEQALLMTYDRQRETWRDFRARCFPEFTLSQLKNQFRLERGRKAKSEKSLGEPMQSIFT